MCHKLYNLQLLLSHTATLTFDPSTLNVCRVPAVTWSNSVPNLSETEQYAAELYRFKD